MLKHLRHIVILSIIFAVIQQSLGQSKDQINWLTFQELDSVINLKPKPVLVFFHAEWCVYCKKMFRVTFKDPKIIQLLNERFYAVSMDAEYRDDIVFDEITYSNQEQLYKRRPVHDIPKLLAWQKDGTVVLPATILLDNEFNVVSRYFEYLDPKRLLGHF